MERPALPRRLVLVAFAALALAGSVAAADSPLATVTQTLSGLDDVTSGGFEPPDARYLFNHRGHFVFVKPEERRFVTAELIRRTTFTATEQELRQRVAALRDAGWNQLVIPITPGQESAIDDWARIRDAFH